MFGFEITGGACISFALRLENRRKTRLHTFVIAQGCFGSALVHLSEANGLCLRT